MERKKKDFRYKRFFLFFIFYVLYYSIWLVAFSPGIFSPDSLYSWKSTSTFILEPGIPFSYTLVILFLRNIVNNPIIVSFFQILVSSFLFSYITSLVKKRFLVVLFLLYTIITPSFGFYNVTLWKDILFAQLILLLCILLNNRINKKNKKTNNFYLLGLSFLVAFTSSLRVNGLPYLVIIPLFYFLFKIFDIRKFLKLLLFSFLFYFLIIKVPFYFIKADNSRDSFMNRSVIMQFIASVLSGNGYIENEDQLVLSKLMPLEDYRSRYRCSAGDYLFLNNDFFNKKIFNDIGYAKQFDKTAINLISNNLPIIIGDRVCLFSHLVGLGEDRWSYLFVEAPSDISQIGYSYNGVEKIKNVLTRYMFWSKKYPQRIFFWSHWFTLLFYVGFFVNAVLKRKKAVLGCLLIILMNVFVLFFIGVARDYRYLYMLQYCLPFIFVIGLNNKKNEK